jgi:hypothetical protein
MDALSGVAQILSRDDEDGNFKSTVEWANLEHQIKKAVAANPKAVGYIEKSAVGASVKVALPLD